MRTFRGLAILVLVIMSGLSVVSVHVRADDGITVTIVSADDTNFPTTTVIVLAEAAGRPLANLVPADVSVEDNGVKGTVATIAHIRDTSLSANVVMTLDVSGSMLGEKLAQAKSALAVLVGGLGPTDNVALISFADRSQLVTPLSRDKSSVSQAIATLNAGGNTALYGAVAESARVASAPGVARKVVVLLTDGEEFGNLSGVSRAESLDRARQSGALFYVIGLGDADRGYLSELATSTGGRFVPAPSSADVQAGFQAIAEILKGQFAITFQSNAPPTPLERKITVTLKTGQILGEATYAFSSQRTLPTVVPTVQAAPTAVVTAPSTPAATSVLTEEHESSRSARIVAISVLVAGIALIAGVGVSHRRRHPASGNLAQPALVLLPEPPVDRKSTRSTATLKIRPGQPGLVDVSEVKLPLEPIDIGSAADAFLRLPTGPDVSARHARLWWRDGTAMLHHVGEVGKTTVNGTDIDWMSLSDGDVIAIGPCSFQFVLGD